MPNTDDAQSVPNIPMIPVVYIGLKDSQTDHDYGTGLTWHGKGDVQLVPEDKVPYLLRHADVWADGRGRSARKNNPIAAKVMPSKQFEQDEEESVTPTVPKIHLMPKSDLQLYALTEFNERLDDALDESATRAAVVRLMNTR